jgi:hypothetical protein
MDAFGLTASSFVGVLPATWMSAMFIVSWIVILALLTWLVRRLLPAGAVGCAVDDEDSGRHSYGTRVVRLDVPKVSTDGRREPPSPATGSDTQPPNAASPG